MKKTERPKLRLKWNRKYAEISLYVIVSCVILYILYGMLSHAGTFFAAVGSSLAWVGSILKPVIIGFIFAYLLYPLCEAVERRLDKREFFREKPRGTHYAGVAITVGGIILGLILLAGLLVITITQQFSSIHHGGISQIINGFTTGLSQMYQGILNWLKDMNVKSAQAEQIVKQIRSALMKQFGASGGSLAGTLNSIKSIGATVLFSILFTVYFMLDWPGLRKYWKRVAETLFGERTTPRLHHIWNDISTVFSGYIRGQMADAIFMMIAVSVTFTIARIPYGIVIGVLTGIGNLVPYLGPIVGYGLTLVSGLSSGNIKVVIIGFIILLIIQGVDGAVVNPRLLSKNVQIHPMLVLIGVIAGNKAGGFLGMLVAVPVTALLKLWFERGMRIIREKKSEHKDDAEGFIEAEAESAGEHREEVERSEQKHGDEF
ncbi:MAG: AI-2E family transporter [Eubacterium sp.]